MESTIVAIVYSATLLSLGVVGWTLIFSSMSLEEMREAWIRNESDGDRTGRPVQGGHGKRRRDPNGENDIEQWVFGSALITSADRPVPQMNLQRRIQGPAPAPVVHPDIVRVIKVDGVGNPRTSWRDSYSVGDRCYCDTAFDDGLDKALVDTGNTLGVVSVVEVCEILGKGPGRRGRPKYNDIQCGNGPRMSADEDACPGRVDIGPSGCGQIGPKWNFVDVPTHPDVDRVIDVSGEASPKKSWRDSYSVGNRCYCDSSFDDGLDEVLVNTKTARLGTRTVKELCALLGPGPGRRGRPQYNDIQCGNGPRVSRDEYTCPGRIDIGSGGCGQIGPKWNIKDMLNNLTPEPTPKPTSKPTPRPISSLTPKVPIHPDIVKIIDVVGEKKPKPNWRDSYSVGDRCYCDTRYDHNIGPVIVDTPVGTMTVRQACKLIGKGPGRDGNPVYNDVQCGNGPPNDWGDEETCPGRTDLGSDGCGHIGPKWNFDDIISQQQKQQQPDSNSQLGVDSDGVIIITLPPSDMPSIEPSDVPSTTTNVVVSEEASYIPSEIPSNPPTS